MNNKSQENYRYIIQNQDVSRTLINVVAAIGLFIFGWLIINIFQMLGKSRIGWAYFVPFLIFSLVGWKFQSVVGLVGLVIYAVACVHANLVFSQYESSARQRLAEIEHQGATDINTLIEKGILLHRIRRQGEAAVNVLDAALRMGSGDPMLMYYAGITMANNKRYIEAIEFFDRALENTVDERQAKLIKAFRSRIEKKLG